LVVGADRADLPTGGVNAGRTYVVFGKPDTNAIDLSAVAAGTGGFQILGESAGDGAGRSVSSAGDVNGDGLTDLLIGAYKSNITGTDSGRNYVVYGTTATNTISLSDVAAGSGGFAINGQAAGDNEAADASFVSAAGDVNGDGFADLIVGALLSDPAGVSNAGRSYVIFGGQQFATAVDFVGDSSANTLTGTTAAETFAGTARRT
jgi:hypothetical protein